MRYDKYIVSGNAASRGAFPGKTYIYFLKDDAGRVRYVGKTKDPRSRYHVYMSNHKLDRDSNTPVHRWISKLRDRGHYPQMFLHEIVDDTLWVERERFWISYYRGHAKELLNICDGGEGSPGFHVSEGAKARISKSLMGHPVSVETREILRETNLGKVLTPEHRTAVGQGSAKSWANMSLEERAQRSKKMHAGVAYDADFGASVSAGKAGRRAAGVQAASQYTGVSQQRGNPSWQVYVNNRGVREYRGSYATEEGAASAYNRRVRELGLALPLNSLQEVEEPRLASNLSQVGAMQAGRTSKYPGVSWNNRKQRWMAQFTLRGKRTIVGQFTDEEVAYAAYQTALDAARAESGKT